MIHDTFNPKRILEAVGNDFSKRVMNERGEAGTPLPETLTQDQDLTGITTVEELVSGYKTAKAGSTYSVPEDIKSDPIFEKYKTQEERDRALVSAQKLLGREKLPIPADENDKDAYALIYKTLGLPEKEDGYEIPTDLNIPKELPIDETLLADFKKTAHGLGVLPQQFKGLYSWYMDSMAKAFNKMNEDKVASAEESEVALRTKHGAAYPQVMALAKKVFSTFVDPKSLPEFEKGLGNNPMIIDLFAGIGKILSEDQLSGTPKGGSETPAEAQAEIKRMEADLKGPLYDAAHPQHKEFKEKRDRLYRLITPSG